MRLKDWSAKVVGGANPAAAVQLSWRPPEEVPKDLHLVYRVYRLDADDPQAASSDDPISKAKLLTPTPVEGEQSFILTAVKADAAAELELGLPTYLSEQPMHQAQIKQEKIEVRRWTDASCALDHAYPYLVVAE